MKPVYKQVELSGILVRNWDSHTYIFLTSASQFENKSFDAGFVELFKYVRKSLMTMILINSRQLREPSELTARKAIDVQFNHLPKTS
jgi:hypothetical protein